MTKIGKYATSGAQGGTVFADPSFARGMDTGKLTRSAIDRFSIVLMGGIAAEAIEYGTSEVRNIEIIIYIQVCAYFSDEATPDGPARDQTLYLLAPPPTCSRTL